MRDSAKMIHFSIKTKVIFTILVFTLWIFIIGLILSGTGQYCAVKSSAYKNVNKENIEFEINFSRNAGIYDCCAQSGESRLWKYAYIVSSDDETSLRVSSKRFHILPRCEYEYFQKSASVNDCSEIKHTLNSSDIPVCTSSLLI